jgi:hypothetical protein
VKAIYVEDMAAVEDSLHTRFKRCNLKLEKSREWFNLNAWQYQQALWAFSRYESHRASFSDLPKRAIVGGLIALVGLGVLIGHGMRSDAPQVQSMPATQKSK